MHRCASIIRIEACEENALSPQEKEKLKLGQAKPIWKTIVLIKTEDITCNHLHFLPG